MTDVINGHSVTDRGDARMRVRVAENPPHGPMGGGSPPRSAHARAIPDNPDGRQGEPRSKVRNFVSLHGGEAAAELVSSWPVTDRPSSLADVARKVWPRRRDQRRSPVRWVAVLAVGVFRLGVYAIAYLLALAVDTEKRAAVALAVALLTVAVICTAQALPI